MVEITKEEAKTLRKLHPAATIRATRNRAYLAENPHSMMLLKRLRDGRKRKRTK